MHRLTPDENNQIINILINYFKNLEKPGQFLHSLISINELQIDHVAIDYNLPVLELITNFFPHLHKNNNILYFLKGFKTYLNLNAQNNIQDIQIINNCIAKLEREDYYGTQSRWNQNNQNIDNFRKNNVSLSFSTENPRKMNRHPFIIHDLECLQRSFLKPLKNKYGGIIAFNITENYDILFHGDIFDSYILSRIEYELKQKGRQDCQFIPITLPISNESLTETIENNLNNLLDAIKLDIILVIMYKSKDTDKEKLNSTAQIILTEIRNRYSFHFNKARYLIIIFGSFYCQCDLKNFYPLVIPKKIPVKIQIQKYEECPLTNWFMNCFIPQNNLEDRKNLCYRALRDSIKNDEGDLILTYRSLKRILDMLQFS